MVTLVDVKCAQPLETSGSSYTLSLNPTVHHSLDPITMTLTVVRNRLPTRTPTTTDELLPIVTETISAFRESVLSTSVNRRVDHT